MKVFICGVFTLILATVLCAGTADAATAQSANRGTVLSYDVGLLKTGDYISNHGFRLIQQGDGNLVEYRNSDNKVCWNSETNGHPGAYTTFNPDFHAYLSVWTPQGGSMRTYSDVHSGGSTVSFTSNGTLYIGYSYLSNAC